MKIKDPRLDAAKKQKQKTFRYSNKKINRYLRESEGCISLMQSILTKRVEFRFEAVGDSNDWRRFEKSYQSLSNHLQAYSSCKLNNLSYIVIQLTLITH